MYTVLHYSDVLMNTMESQITSLTIVYSIIYSGADQRKLQSSMSLAFVQEIYLWPMNSPSKGPVMRKTFNFDDVIKVDKYDTAQSMAMLHVWHQLGHNSQKIHSHHGGNCWGVSCNVLCKFFRQITISFWNMIVPSDRLCSLTETSVHIS